MTLDELITKLDELGMPKGYFSTNELIESSIHVAYYEYNKKWRVYCHERDNYAIDECFTNLNDAYSYVYERAKQDVKNYLRK